MGIIDTLSAGFGLVARRPWLLVVPVGVDLLLWIGPHLSVEPLVNRLLGQYEALVAEARVDEAGSTSQLLQGWQAGREVIAGTGRVNVLTLLTSPIPQGVTTPTERILGSPVPFMVVAAPLPSLLAYATAGELGQLIDQPVLTVESAALLIGLWPVLVVVSLGAASAYRTAAAQSLSPLSADPSLSRRGRVPGFPASMARDFGRGWLRLAGLFGLSLLFLLFVMLPLVVIGALLFLVQPALGTLVLLFASVVPFWMRLYFYFCDGAIFVSRVGLWAALRRSYLVVRRNLWASLALVGLIHFILYGTSVVWRAIQGHPMGVMAGIFGNAYVATGLVLSSYIFYQERVSALEAAPKRV
ncbi:MAG: hypothetical protein HYY05_07815 [Chloroflexi bacterium]|nr:hypothetical protein [Chloroflexota bacterium]